MSEAGQIAHVARPRRPAADRGWRSYPAYRDSGIEWLGRVPAHWSPIRLAYLFDEVRRPVAVDPNATYQEIGVCSHGRGVFHKEPLFGADLEDKSVFWLQPGLLVFNIVFAWEGAVAVTAVPEQGMIASHRFPTFAARRDYADVQYFCHFFMTSAGLALLDHNSPGAAGRNRTLDRRALLKEQVFVPPLEEQRAITAFLGRETARIEALVEKKQRLIDLLREKRQTLITQAVTQGLDPETPLKEPGIECLSRIPAHWDVVTMRRAVRSIEQGWSPQAEERTAGDGEWAVIKLSAVNKGTFRSDEHKGLPPELPPERRFEIRPGDFLITRSNTPDLVGDVCIAESPRTRLMLCDLVYRLGLDRRRVVPRFLLFWLLGSVCRFQITRDARGSSQTMVKISQGHIRSWTLVLPPLDEQTAIA
ncbi:MAG: hypothetical protein FJ125_10085, partial [Deltaproteobacteria bacterium]|nr:hypothetical protein [Deltaproteobacteria bacterium]